ncbi:MAG: segregation/condensation protein A [Deltaproteobacteria bacterium]|nr:segregation/condensation protein A [Deltaproteobacteria bacterium]
MELNQDYKVNLPAFEGPLDLLLYLIRKNDLDVYDIPISFITEEYLKYLDTMRELNIDLAGEFLAMAAELILIKSKTLLPSMDEEAEEEETDPRAELAKRLLEYQRFKMAASRLQGRWMLGRDLFLRTQTKEEETETEAPIMGEVFQLMSAFSDVLKRLPKDVYHEVAVDRLSTTDRIYQLIDLLNMNTAMTLSELLPDPLTRYDVVITFLALLEMSRLKMIKVYQESQFNTISIRKVMETLAPDADIQLVEAQ